MALVGVTNGEETFLTFANSQAISQLLIETGEHQKEDFLRTLDILRKRGAKPGGWFVDIGANIGTQTVYALTSKHFRSAL
ncbi:MAG: hypothetical protein AB7P12_17535, partial [Alphaproteobacteria bacterium]